MFGLYFGNVPSLLSTLVFIAFAGYFIMTLKRPESNKKWKKSAIITVLAGTLMSALCGIKDSTSKNHAVSFEQMNPALAVLCILGGLAVVSGIAAGISKREKFCKVMFFILSFIILAKTVTVEALRIINYLE